VCVTLPNWHDQVGNTRSLWSGLRSDYWSFPLCLLLPTCIFRGCPDGLSWCMSTGYNLCWCTKYATVVSHSVVTAIAWTGMLKAVRLQEFAVGWVKFNKAVIAVLVSSRERDRVDAATLGRPKTLAGGVGGWEEGCAPYDNLCTLRTLFCIGRTNLVRQYIVWDLSTYTCYSERSEKSWVWCSVNNCHGLCLKSGKFSVGWNGPRLFFMGGFEASHLPFWMYFQ